MTQQEIINKIEELPHRIHPSRREYITQKRSDGLVETSQVHFYEEEPILSLNKAIWEGKRFSLKEKLELSERLVRKYEI